MHSENTGIRVETIGERLTISRRATGFTYRLKARGKKGTRCLGLNNMSSPTELYLPQSFPYPIKVVSLDVNPAANVERGTRLLSYSFVHLPASPGAQPETRFGTWDASVEGTLDAWKVKKGDVISERRGREKPVVLITEPCKHGVQIGGLCGLCGKDMTEYVPILLVSGCSSPIPGSYDYTGFSDASRASIQMTHSAFGPTVSFEEAQRIEWETAEHLLKSRKLSLIVDLDQTIVHATVDPTVGDWIAEGEAWEARQAQKAASASKHEGKDDSDDSDDTLSDSEDECNPNWEALKDVKKFRLGPESFGAPPSRNGKGKQKLENDGCMYYIKPRYESLMLTRTLSESIKGPTGKNSCEISLLNTKCTCTQWVREHTPRRSALQLIQMGRSSAVDFSVETRVAVSPCVDNMGV